MKPSFENGLAEFKFVAGATLFALGVATFLIGFWHMPLRVKVTVASFYFFVFVAGCFKKRSNY